MTEYVLSFADGLKAVFYPVFFAITLSLSVIRLFVLPKVIAYAVFLAAFLTMLFIQNPASSVYFVAQKKIFNGGGTFQDAMLIIFYAAGLGAILYVATLLMRGVEMKYLQSTKKKKIAAGFIALCASSFFLLGLFGAQANGAGREIPPALTNPLLQSYQAPEIQGITSWINTPSPLSLQSLKGKVVLVYFWTYACYNCVNTLPYIKKWDSDYRDRGFQVLGVHTPEFEFEYKRDKVAAAVAHHSIEFPVALDNGFHTWNAYRNRYWPAFYLVNKQGRVVYTHFGEGKYAQTEDNIRFLLQN